MLEFIECADIVGWNKMTMFGRSSRYNGRINLVVIEIDGCDIWRLKSMIHVDF